MGNLKGSEHFWGNQGSRTLKQIPISLELEDECNQSLFDSVWAGTSTWMFAIRQERKEGKADFKKVMEHCSGCFKPIFRFLKLKFDIDIPPSIDMDASFVVIINHQHALDAYLLNQVLNFAMSIKF